MYADIPVIMMSSVSEEIAMQRLEPLNIDYYITKDSFNQNKFIEKVRSLLTDYHNK